MDKPPVVLPGEDQDPLAWVRNARDVETDTVVTAPRRSGRRPQPEQAQEAAEPTGSTAANVGADSNARQVSEAEEEPEETHVLPRTPDAKAQAAIERLKTPRDIKRYLRARQGYEAALEACEQIWPAWSANGCRKLNLRGSAYGAVKGPRPAEAAAALRAATAMALRSYTGGERLLKARDRRLLGLIEALGLAPPRPPPGEAVEEQDEVAATLASAAESMPASEPFAEGASASAATSGAAPQWTDRSSKMHPVCVTDAMWSLAVMGGPVLFEREMDALISGADLTHAAWRPVFVADLLWALALAHHWTPRLLEAEALVQRLGGLPAMTAREAASSLWACATLGHTPKTLLQEVEAEGGWRFAHPRPSPGLELRRIDALSGKQLATAAWSLAALKLVDSAAFRELWQEVGRRGLDGMGTEQKMLMQVHQVALSVDLEGDERRPEGAGAEELLTNAADAWQYGIRPVHKKQESYHEGQIASALVGLGRFHAKEDVSSGYSVDLSIPSARIAIEADGPSHMARNDLGRLLGHARMKHRHLGLLGWKVLSVPFHEWDELLGSAEKRLYLQDRLDPLLHG